MAAQHQEQTVEWYRPVLLGRLIAVWLVGSALIGVGGISSAVAFDLTGRFSEPVQAVALVAGVLCAVGGALFGLLGILRVLMADPVWLLIRLDGVVYHTEHDEVTIPWQRLQGARWDARALIIEREGAAALEIRRRFMGISGPDLAARIIELQRQALMGVLRQRAP